MDLTAFGNRRPAAPSKCFDSFALAERSADGCQLALASDAFDSSIIGERKVTHRRACQIHHCVRTVKRPVRCNSFQTTCVIPIIQFAPIGGAGHWTHGRPKIHRNTCKPDHRPGDRGALFGMFLAFDLRQCDRITAFGRGPDDRR